jgi:Ca2+-binding EF-hand superfamily protein
MSERVKITIHRAVDVPKMDFMGHADPYVRVLFPAGDCRACLCLKTSTVKSCATPVWEESVVLSFDAGHHKAALELYDEDITSDELIGKLTVDLREDVSRAKFKVEGAKNASCAMEISVERLVKPPSSTAAAAEEEKLAKRTTNNSVLARMTLFVSEHCPSRMEEIPALLSMGSDFNERSYCMALYDEQGVPVTARRFSPTFEERLVKFYQAFDAGKTDSVPDQLDAAWAKLLSEEDVWGKLFAKYSVPAEMQAVYQLPERQQQPNVRPGAAVLPLAWEPHASATWISAFAEYDRNKSGTISKKELNRMLTERGVKSESAAEIIARADANNSGTIEVPEFIRSMVHGSVTKEMVHEFGDLPAHLLIIFLRSVDSNGSGDLSAKEVERFMKALGVPVARESLKANYTFKQFQEYLKNF